MLALNLKLKTPMLLAEDKAQNVKPLPNTFAYVYVYVYMEFNHVSVPYSKILVILM